MVRFSPSAYISTGDDEKIKEPRTYQEAISSPEANEWLHAMSEEMQALMTNGTWEYVNRPSGTTVLPHKWVFKLKLAMDGTVERFKARLVVGGHRQRDDIDYADVFAPVGRFASMRTLLAKVAAEDMELHAVDISNAFLNGNLDIPVYMAQPEGFDNGNPNEVCKLKKTLYGLKQAPREWYRVLSEGLGGLGLTASENDQALWTGDGIIVLHWVDDLLIAANDLKALSEVKKKILSRYKGRDLGPAEAYLNMLIERDREARTLKISQPKHIDEVLRRFDMDESRPNAVPMSAGADLTKRKANEASADKTTYAGCVGALMYLAAVTRPDLCTAVHMLAQHMADPAERHWTQLKGVLRYLAGTRALGITYGTSEDKMAGWSDADYATCKDTRRSRTGFIYTVYGGAVAWTSKKQSVVAQSSAESEYIAGAAAAREGAWLRRMCWDLGVAMDSTPVLHMDNRAAISMGENAADSARTKHIEVAHHYLRATVARRVLRLLYTPTDENVADLFTKPLAGAKFGKFVSMAGMR